MRVSGKEFTECLMEAIKNNSLIEADEDDSILFDDVEDVKTFEEAGVLTTNDGCVVYRENQKIYITVQVFDHN